MQISLLPGQVQGLALARATVLGVSTGELVLTRRIRLDTDVLVVKTRLRAGAVFIAQQPEWVELTSLCVAEVWVRPAVVQVGQHHPALWRPFKWPKFAALAQFAAKARVAKPTTRF